jgi:hypothetical protein
MRIFSRIPIYFSGLLLMLAAFPVFGQEPAPREITINKRPLLDLGYRVLDDVETRKVDLTAPFSVHGSGKLNKDGKLDASTSKFTAASGDKEMIEIAKNSIAAINDSGYLQYLSRLGCENLDFTIVQDSAIFSTTIVSELESARRAQSVRNALSLMLGFYKQKISGPDADENDKDSLEIVKNALIETNNNKVTIKVVLPKAVVQALIQKSLRSAAKHMSPPAGFAQNIVY